MAHLPSLQGRELQEAAPVPFSKWVASAMLLVAVSLMLLVAVRFSGALFGREWLAFCLLLVADCSRSWIVMATYGGPQTSRGFCGAFQQVTPDLRDRESPYHINYYLPSLGLGIRFPDLSAFDEAEVGVQLRLERQQVLTLVVPVPLVSNREHREPGIVLDPDSINYVWFV
jgi:hypothetical protein